MLETRVSAIRTIPLLLRLSIQDVKSIYKLHLISGVIDKLYK
jgi:hypothetical protein